MNQNKKELSNKYPVHKGHTAFVNKLLAKKQTHKYFDSADYQMALQNPEQGPAMGDGWPITGELMPTPQAIAASKSQLRKLSPLVQLQSDSSRSSVSIKLESLEGGEPLSKTRSTMTSPTTSELPAIGDQQSEEMA